jgi:catechol 2,3-dioxygenase-like lactoylglutathione lyase family enzyme
MKQACDHIGFFTAHAEAMKEFYTRILGFEPGNETELSKSVVENIFGIAERCRFIKLHKNGFMLEIFEPISSETQMPTSGKVGINHWGYCVADRTHLIEKLRKDSIPVIEIKRDGRNAYFLVDPDGNRIELRECFQEGEKV